MNVMRQRVLWVLLVVLLLSATSTTQAQSDLEQVRDTVEALQDEIDAYLAQLVETQERADAAGARYWEADLALYELDAEIARLSEQAAAIDAEVAELRAQMIEIAVQRYIDSGTPPVDPGRRRHQPSGRGRRSCTFRDRGLPRHHRRLPAGS